MSLCGQGPPFGRRPLPLVRAELRVGNFSLATDGSWKARRSSVTHLGGAWGDGGFGGDALNDSQVPLSPPTYRS